LAGFTFLTYFFFITFCFFNAFFYYFLIFFTYFLGGGDFLAILGGLGFFLMTFLALGFLTTFLTGFSTGFGKAGTTFGGSTLGGATLHYLLFFALGTVMPIGDLTPLKGCEEQAIITS
jgi:hypothetical protein